MTHQEHQQLYYVAAMAQIYPLMNMKQYVDHTYQRIVINALSAFKDYYVLLGQDDTYISFKIGTTVESMYKVKKLEGYVLVCFYYNTDPRKVTFSVQTKEDISNYLLLPDVIDAVKVYLTK